MCKTFKNMSLASHKGKTSYRNVMQLVPNFNILISLSDVSRALIQHRKGKCTWCLWYKLPTTVTKDNKLPERGQVNIKNDKWFCKEPTLFNGPAVDEQ